MTRRKKKVDVHLTSRGTNTKGEEFSVDGEVELLILNFALILETTPQKSDQFLKSFFHNKRLNVKTAFSGVSQNMTSPLFPLWSSIVYTLLHT